MQSRTATIYALICTAACGMAHAAAPPNAPAGTTALCKDGSFYTGPIKQGACDGHDGVREWYEAPPASISPSTPSAVPPETATETPPAQDPARLEKKNP